LREGRDVSRSSSPGLPEELDGDRAATAEGLVGDGEEEVGEGEGLDAKVGEAAHVEGEGVALVGRGADGPAMVEEVEAPGGVFLEAEGPCRVRPSGDGEGGRGEVGEVGGSAPAP
jgi:hypothetical protein